ncbi:MAG: triose-phosphate isomerase [Candidatus Woesearchaeota archaeon]
MALVVANWKMNKDLAEVQGFFKEFNKLRKNTKADVVICPSFTLLNEAQRWAKGIKLGAQNIASEEKGAFTGEVSAAMVKEFCDYVIIGHSERRIYYNENDEQVNKKVKLAIEHKLTPIICIGENLEERKKGKTQEVVKRQLEAALKGVKETDIVIAYEPIWAISTFSKGEIATPEQAEKVHEMIAGLLEKKYYSNKIRVIYGGSVTPENVKALMQQKNIKGVLVGGGSLKPESFAAIANYGTST